METHPSVSSGSSRWHRIATSSQVALEFEHLQQRFPPVYAITFLKQRGQILRIAVLAQHVLPLELAPSAPQLAGEAAPFFLDPVAAHCGGRCGVVWIQLHGQSLAFGVNASTSFTPLTFSRRGRRAGSSSSPLGSGRGRSGGREGWRGAGRSGRLGVG